MRVKVTCYIQCNDFCNIISLLHMSYLVMHYHVLNCLYYKVMNDIRSNEIHYNLLLIRSINIHLNKKICKLKICKLSGQLLHASRVVCDINCVV